MDVIDTRELVDELADLEDIPEDERDDWDTDRIAAIKALADDLGDLTNGYTLVAESDFEAYVQDDLPQIVEIPDFLQPYIDWEKLAGDMSSDWSHVSFDGTDYLYRG